MRIAIIGTGYVGLTTAVALAYIGHQVTAVDQDRRKLDLLAHGTPPIFEYGLEPLLAQLPGRIAYSDRTTEAVADAEVIFIAVGTPPKPNGEADTRAVETVVREIAEGVRSDRPYVIVIKSTVPIGTNRRAAHLMQRALDALGKAADIHFVSNPEFLRESMALKDTLYPDRIALGTESPTAVDALHKLYRPILEQTFTPPTFLPRPEGYRLPHLITTDPTSAEMIKYAANAFLPVKISFINEIAGLCEKVGANVSEVARGIGLDSRIGHHFLDAGLGWGGSCFPKDTAALIATAGEFGYTLPIIEAACTVNRRQRLMIIDKLQSALHGLRGRIVGVLGLAFKPDTDDVRDAPALEIIRTLLARGAHVRAHDPVALANGRQALADLDMEFSDDAYAAATGADALVLATEWRVYRELDLPRLAALMRTPLLLDGRNLFSPADAHAAGFQYMGVGK